MGNRMYTKNDCTVFSYDGDTSLLSKLGEGTLGFDSEQLRNSALLDTDTDFESGPATWRVEAELACEDDDTSWFTRRGGSGTLTVTTDVETVSGTFGVVSARRSMSGPMRWNVVLENKGTVTVT